MHRKDVDDRAGRSALAQVVDEPLHQKEWGSRVDGEEPLPEPHVSFRERSPVGESGGIDQRVDAAEPLERRVEDQIRRAGVLEIRRHEQGGRAASLDLRRCGRAFARVSARHHETLGAGARGRLRDGQADALG